MSTFKVKKELKEFDCLKNFKFVPRKRVFPEVSNEENRVKSKRPLDKINISANTKLSRKNAEIKLIIERLGGKLATHVSSTTVALIANAEQVDKMNKKVQEAKDFDVHVVDEAFINDLSTENVNIEELILKHNIGSWGSDLKKRIELSKRSNEDHQAISSDLKYSKSASSGSGLVKMKIKGGAVVDPDSGRLTTIISILNSQLNFPI